MSRSALHAPCPHLAGDFVGHHRQDRATRADFGPSEYLVSLPQNSHQGCLNDPGVTQKPERSFVARGAKSSTCVSQPIIIDALASFRGGPTRIRRSFWVLGPDT